MLEYYKTILSKVGFDAPLFEKELAKAIRSLKPGDQLILREWCYEQFKDDYLAILQDHFEDVSTL